MEPEYLVWGLGIIFLLIDVLPKLLKERALDKINSLTIDDFSIEKREKIEKINTKDFYKLAEVRKDKNGDIYYFINGILYTYGSTAGISLAITDSESWEQLYRVTKKQYEDFMNYTKGVDCIEVSGNEIHFRLPKLTQKTLKLHVKNPNFYAGKLQIPYLNEKVEFSDEELEKILSAIKEELKKVVEDG